jgi:cytidine deaminase
METSIQSLFDAAKRARENAHAPYSSFKVGAAIETQSGDIFAGCNVENVAYPEGTCAEAGAIAHLVASQGKQQITAVLVIADCDEPITPCGGCRQKLAEFGSGETRVYLAGLDGLKGQTTLAEILPGAFSQSHLEG